MKLHCMVYILGPFISPSLTLLLAPDWFILGEELPSSSLQLSDLAADVPISFPALVLGLDGRRCVEMIHFQTVAGLRVYQRAQPTSQLSLASSASSQVSSTDGSLAPSILGSR